MKFTEEESKTFNQNWVTGPVLVNNFLINPTLEELKKWGVGYLQNEPVYIGENNGVKYVDIVYWAKSVDDPTVIINWKNRITAKYLVSQDGLKTCYINDKGSTKWIDSVDNLPGKFKTPTVRKALQGEEEFYSFMIAFNNIKFPSDNAAFESILESEESFKALFAGKFNELKVANTYPNKKIRIIAGLIERNDKFYATVYNKIYFKSWVDGDKFKPYLWESSEKYGGVTWDYYINYLTNVDTNSRFNPVLITPEPKVWSLAEIKEALPKVVTTEEPTLFSAPTGNVPGSISDLPF